MKYIYFFLCIFLPMNVMADNVKWVLSGIKGGEFHDGRCVVDNGANKKPHVIDRNGKIVIPAIYDNISDFVDGCAIVSNGDNKQGIIDINGKIILPLEYNIKDVSKETKTQWNSNYVKGLYIVRKDDKQGLFYKSAFIEPLSSDNYISVLGYPLVKIKKNLFVDIHTMKHYYTTSLCQNPITYARSDEHEDLIFDGTNKSIPVSDCQSSSTGITIFKDNNNDLYGLKDANGSIVLPAEYMFGRHDIDKPYVIRPFWVHDLIELKENNGDEIVVNKNGKIIFRGSVSWIDNYGNILGTPKGSEHDAVINQNGDYVIPAETPIFSAYTFKENYYLVDIHDKDNLQLLYHVPSKKFLDVKVLNIAASRMTEDMLQISDKSGKEGFLDLKNGTFIKPKYDIVYPFSEGVAKVSNYKSGGGAFFINRKGKIILSEGDTYYFGGDRFTEGVLCESGISGSAKYGYIVNPLGTDYKYAVPSDTPPDHYDKKNWMSKGIDLFNSKKYSEAKDYFQKICIIDPSNLNALVNYGACLCNMGFYEEGLESFRMVADMNPNFEDIQKRIIETKEWIKQKQQQQHTVQNTNIQNNNKQVVIKQSTPWLVLSAIADAMSTMASSFSGQQKTGLQITNHYYEAESYSPNISKTSKSASTYQMQYDKWARNAERIYNAITLLGVKVERKDGSHTGSSLQSMGVSNYTAMKHNLRTAQRNMRELRMDAMRNGITINESKYETATVSW